MNSQYKKDNCVFLSKKNEIIDVNRFRKLDIKYKIVDVCKELKLHYEFNESSCSVYSPTFVSNISFNGLKINSIVCFVDREFSNDSTKKKLTSFLKELTDSSVSSKHLNSVLNEEVKELRNVNDEVEFYARRVMTDNREMHFISITIKG